MAAHGEANEKSFEAASMEQIVTFKRKNLDIFKTEWHSQRLTNILVYFAE